VNRLNAAEQQALSDCESLIWLVGESDERRLSLECDPATAADPALRAEELAARLLKLMLPEWKGGYTDNQIPIPAENCSSDGATPVGSTAASGLVCAASSDASVSTTSTILIPTSTFSIIEGRETKLPDGSLHVLPSRSLELVGAGGAQPAATAATSAPEITLSLSTPIILSNHFASNPVPSASLVSHSPSPAKSLSTISSPLSPDSDAVASLRRELDATRAKAAEAAAQLTAMAEAAQSSQTEITRLAAAAEADRLAREAEWKRERELREEERKADRDAFAKQAAQLQQLLQEQVEQGKLAAAYHATHARLLQEQEEHRTMVAAAHAVQAKLMAEQAEQRGIALASKAAQERLLKEQAEQQKLALAAQQAQERLEREYAEQQKVILATQANLLRLLKEADKKIAKLEGEISSTNESAGGRQAMLQAQLNPRAGPSGAQSQDSLEARLVRLEGEHADISSWRAQMDEHHGSGPDPQREAEARMAWEQAKADRRKKKQAEADARAKDSPDSGQDGHIGR
jgi:hypothetical protein